MDRAQPLHHWLKATHIHEKQDKTGQYVERRTLFPLQRTSDKNKKRRGINPFIT